jgi:hypothetical protein
MHRVKGQGVREIIVFLPWTAFFAGFVLLHLPGRPLWCINQLDIPRQQIVPDLVTAFKILVLPGSSPFHDQAFNLSGLISRCRAFSASRARQPVRRFDPEQAQHRTDLRYSCP